MTGLMLPAVGVGAAQSWRGYDPLQIVRKLGLTANLQIALDPGDATSYTSGDKWLDRSGNGYDFHRGADATTSGSEPTHNGTVGRLSSGEYWSFDGGDYFTYDTTNEAWMETLHKDNAVFSACAWFQVSDTNVAVQALISTQDNTTPNGIRWNVTAGEVLNINVSNDGAAVFNGGGVTVAGLAGTWIFGAISINEVGNVSIGQVNSTQNIGTCTYSSPSANAADGAFKIGARGTTNILRSGALLGPVWFWTRALSSGELNAMFMATRGRFNK